ncbi:alpha-N-acetylglucosaminidase [Rhizomicrobium palustre]|uniref:Alpha-N-acetylglucosaminidase n=1 Tax=Rhizomicrobium palustre TaxID=189966 RepID=A0A846N0L9_9PROT|nr:alpha-N-acetylglucosaminidase [Rhizomicrobium palustre]NIK88891.1 alpha-N-acetylglucosaminidase [Rhizomicrobium palustre]
MTATALRAEAGHNADAPAQVLKRLIGPRADDFDLRLVQETDTKPRFSVAAKEGRVAVEANTSAGLTRGAYAYLTAIGAAQFNWEGDRVALPARWPDFSISRSETFYRHRAYLNPCAFGYTAPFWEWPRWERELDWMALHGVDMPLALEGQEFIWRQLWSDAGLSEAELAGYFCGPAFLPWQRMGNIEGYGSLPLGFIEKKRVLQHRLLGRMRELNMRPVLPAFAGYVPKAFALRHPEARIHKMTPWGGFHETYWLDPTDPLFEKLAHGFLDRYTAEYGGGEVYLADAFNEMRPPVADKSAGERAEILSGYGKALYASLDSARPGAVLSMQAWLFGIDPEFWDEASIAAFLRDIPADKTLILDIANDTYPGVWEKAKAFSGKSWLFGYIHDFGGNNPLFGDLPLVNKDLSSLPARADTGKLEGFGIFPEGLNTNSIIYEFMFDRAWKAANAPEDIDAWLVPYLQARYGKTDPALLSAWKDLWHGVYQVPNWRTGWWKGAFGQYLFTKRPDMALSDFGPELGDHTALQRAAEALLKLAPRYLDAPLFKIDLVSVITHRASLCIDMQLLTLLKAYAASDPHTAARAWNKARQMILHTDALLAAQPFTLSRWINEARSYGQTPQEAAIYVENAKTQVTIWGGDAVLKDYASKAWAGLYRHFYLPRWAMFVRAQEKALRHKSAFDQKRLSENLVRWETAWAKSPKDYPVRPPLKLLDEAARLLSDCAKG